MKVWVLDLVGYDARGGNARVFSDLQAAKDARDWVVWKQEDDGSWIEDPPGYPTADVWTVSEHQVEP